MREVTFAGHGLKEGGGGANVLFILQRSCNILCSELGKCKST